MRIFCLEKRFHIYLSYMHLLNNEESLRVFKKRVDIMNTVLSMFTCVVSCGIQSIQASFGHCHAYRNALTVSCPQRKASEFSDKESFIYFSWAKAFQRNLYSGNNAWRPITGKKNWEISHFWLGSTGALRPRVLSPYLSKLLFFRIMLCVAWI